MIQSQILRTQTDKGARYTAAVKWCIGARKINWNQYRILTARTCYRWESVYLAQQVMAYVRTREEKERGSSGVVGVTLKGQVAEKGSTSLSSPFCRSHQTICSAQILAAQWPAYLHTNCSIMWTRPCSWLCPREWNIVHAITCCCANCVVRFNPASPIPPAWVAERFWGGS
jgi:hypothetical protein